MKQIVLFIGIVLLLSACKTTKETRAESQVVFTEQTTVSQKTSELNLDNSVIEIDENTQVVVTTYSLPDSAGKQYISSIAEISKNKTATNKKNIATEKETLQDEKKVKTENSQLKKSENSQTETKTPGWLYLLIGIISIGIVFLIFFVLKRYRILK